MPSTLSDRLSREWMGVFLGGEAVHVFRAVNAEEFPEIMVPLCGRDGIRFVRPPQKVVNEGYLCQRCRRRLEGEESNAKD